MIVMHPFSLFSFIILPFIIFGLPYFYSCPLSLSKLSYTLSMSLFLFILLLCMIDLCHNLIILCYLIINTGIVQYETLVKRIESSERILYLVKSNITCELLFY